MRPLLELCTYQVTPSEHLCQQLIADSASAPSPEHINDGIDTHPSARLQALPGYKKPVHGVLLAKRIGLGLIRAECRHFDGWLAKLGCLEPLS